MIKWTQKLHDYWKGKCEDDSLELPKDVTDAIYAFIQQIEYLRKLINEDIDHQMKRSSKDDKRIIDLEHKVLELEKKLGKPEKPLSSVGIFYRNGKPLKRKPKDTQEKQSI
jgi:Mg2+ and Co2+ transporter CorA